MDILALFAICLMFLAPIALGIGCAWALYAWTKKRWMWALAPVFALVWLSCVTVPMLGMGLYLPYRAKLAAPPAVPAPAPVQAPAQPDDAAGDVQADGEAGTDGDGP